ncbi:MAG: hypothetical protein ABSC64_03010 [Candidatus Korobacteraceae bacterium]|jgi:hypothetical protein
MILTASDVSSLAKSLSRWEVAEYIFAGLVTVACAGEYVADFKDWFTGGDKAKKERLAKASTLCIHWGNPIYISRVGDADKNWIICDNTATSPYYGNCYVGWDTPRYR